MYGSLNGYTFNGAATPNWVVRAVVAAVAAATFSAAPTRFAYGSVLGNASVNVSLVDTHQISAWAGSTALATSALFPYIVRSGNVDAQATATGTGAVLNYSFASAGGDASCTGLALTSQAIGDASNTAESTVADCIPHIVFSASSLVYGQATGEAAGDVTRYPTVQGAIGEAIYSRAEARYSAFASGFYLDDGYVLAGSAVGSSTATVPQAGMLVTAHFAAFEISGCDATANTFIRYTTRANGSSVCTAQAVSANQIFFRTASGDVAATVVATPQRITKTTATAASGTATYGPVALIKHASSASGYSTASSNQPPPKYHGSGAANASASAGLVSTAFGNQLFGGVSQSCSATSYPVASNINFAGNVLANSTAALVSMAFGTQYRADTTGLAAATSSAVRFLSNFAGTATGTGTAQVSPVIFGSQQFSDVIASAISNSSAVNFLSGFAGGATGTATAQGVRADFGAQHMAESVASGVSDSLPVGTLAVFAGQVNAPATAQLVSAEFGTQHMATVDASATAQFVRADWGTQYRSTVDASCIASSLPVSFLTNFAAQVNATASAQCLQAYKGTQYHANAVATSDANAPLVNGLYVFYSGATGIGSAQCLRAPPARQYYEFVTAQSEEAGVYVSALQKFSAHAFGAGSGLVAHITAIANSDTKAPDERYMIVGSDDRVMVVPYEDRMMVVA